MRKSQHRQILELLESIKEAQSSGLYADCQAGASSIGEFIEQIEGEGTRTVALLEEYCELLYRAHLGETGERPLNKQLIKIENSVKHELKADKIEIAFISYKASMGDSLESIYLAAKSDPGCDAYWIPIPYYIRNPDGSFGTMHYEGAGCYKETIDVTDWREYDIEARHPDAIFTYSPYDANNHISSIHPGYYCERLCNLTDLLVYVPYTVFGDLPDRVHCITQGCVFAHKVILESEKMREYFIEEYKKYYGSEYGILQDKFVALGSPKYDRVINSEREDFQMPEKWRALIGGKKVILYNLSIAAALEGNEQYLIKLRHVLETFRKKSDNVALWLRPHPLTGATYQSMRPHLLNEYMQIITRYRNEGWGIYDDTPDLHRAIAWTDFYYGDISSVLTLYDATGKPAMVQNADVICDNSIKKSLQFESFYDDGEFYWFVAFELNALFKMNKQNWKAEYIGSFPDEDAYIRSYSYIAKCEDKLYFAPHSANEIAIYDTKTNAFEKVPFLPPKSQVCPLYELAKLCTPITVGKRVLFIPYYYPGIICYDTSTKSLSYHDDWVADVERLRTVKERGYFIDCFFDGARLIMPCYCACAIVVFDVNSMISEVWNSKDTYDRQGYSGVTFDGTYFYFLLGADIILKRKMESPDEPVEKINIEIHSSNNRSEKNYEAIYSMQYLDGCIWMFPYVTKGDVLKIEISTGAVAIVHELYKNCECVEELQSFWCSVTIDEHIYAVTRKGLYLIEYNPKENTARMEQITVSKRDTARIMECFVETGCLIHENEIFFLDDMLGNESILLKKEPTKSGGTDGKTIYEYAKKLAEV